MIFEHLSDYWKSSDFRKHLTAKRVIVVLVALIVGLGAWWGWHAFHTSKPTEISSPKTSKSNSPANASNQMQKTQEPTAVKFEPGWYQLIKGDMLSDLALRTCGHANWMFIVKANPGLPHDLRKIRAGWWIYLPPCSEKASPCKPCMVAAHKQVPIAPVAAETLVAKMTDADRLLEAAKHPAEATELATIQPALTEEIDDPPVQSMDLTGFSMASSVAIAIPVVTNKTAGNPTLQKSIARNPKGYAIVLPPGMTAAMVDRQLETRVYFFEPGEKVASSQHRIGNSEVKVQKGRFVLYVPTKSLPSQRFNLAVAGLSGPVSGQFVRENGTPVYRHFPVSSHRLAHLFFGTGQDAGSGAIAYFALGPIAGASAFVVTTVIRLARDHHEKISVENEEAAKDAVLNANLDLERGEQQQTALVATSRGRAP